MRRGIHGAVLLEVIVALAILSVGAVTALATLRDASLAVERSRQAETRFRHADRFLQAVALWSRQDLERRLGTHPQGPYRLDIERPQEGLFHVILIDSLTGAELLQTALYRREDQHGFP
jgi:type II secretory pathway component PulJ